MTRNDITGDKIETKPATKAYRDGHDRIFAKRAESCPRCGGSGHVPEDCKWPVIEEDYGWTPEKIAEFGRALDPYETEE